MGKRYEATFKCTVSIEFEEDDSEGALVLIDQAIDAFHSSYSELKWWDSSCIEIEEIE